MATDQDYRDAVKAIRIAWLRQNEIVQRLAWESLGQLLDADTIHMVIAEQLINGGS